MKCERGVLCEKGAVKKKLVFSSTTIADGKRAFNLYKSPTPLMRKQLVLIVARFCPYMEPLCHVSKAKPGRVIPGSGIIGTAERGCISVCPTCLL
jgi:hypothetical protein